MTHWPWLGVAMVCGSADAATPLWTVQTAENAAQPVAFAAEELSRTCSQIFETPFPVHGSTQIEENSLLLVHGESIPLELDAVWTGLHALPEEGIRIQALPQGILLQGEQPRAVLYAVYTFLEACLGCRWYTPDPEDQIVPHHSLTILEKILGVGVLAEEAPDFAFRQREFRDVSPEGEALTERIIQQVDWWAKLRMNRFLINFGYARNPSLWEAWKGEVFPEIKKRGLLLGLGEHGSYPLFLPPTKYAKEHPDWYCEIDGGRVAGFRTKDGKGTQFCTSNEKAIETYLDNFEAFARANPEIDYFYPAPNDVGLWCECEVCRQKSVADRYMTLDNAIADRLSRIDASYRVVHLAYANHREPPENTLPHEKMIVDVACWGRDFAWALSDPRTMPGKEDYLTAFTDWHALCKETGAGLVYHCKLMRHLWLSFHPLPLKVLDADFEQVKTLGLEGFDFPLGFVGIWTKAPNAYAVARKSWNAQEAADAIGEEFLRLYYGGSAEEAREILGEVRTALPSLQYGSNPALVWQGKVTQPHGQDMEEERIFAERAVKVLGETVQKTEKAVENEKDKRTKKRLQWLEQSVRQVLGEQTVLLAIARVSQSLCRWQEAKTEEERLALKLEASSLADQACAQADAFASLYDLEADRTGLLWLGNSNQTLKQAAEAWRDHVEVTTEDREWQRLDTWTTQEFPDEDPTIEKRIDVSSFLTKPGRVFVRWKWTGGELGMDVLETSLWEIMDGKRILVSRDAHKGFTGWQDRSPMYTLELKRRKPGAKYEILGRLHVYLTRGTVQERGTQGEVLICPP